MLLFWIPQHSISGKATGLLKTFRCFSNWKSSGKIFLTEGINLSKRQTKYQRYLEFCEVFKVFYITNF